MRRAEAISALDHAERAARALSRALAFDEVGKPGMGCQAVAEAERELRAALEALGIRTKEAP